MTETYEAPPLTCVNHPQTETNLRCNRCERPICTRCAVLTPTGYRCKDCVRGLQKTFNTAQWYDYPLAFLVAGGLSLLGSLAVGTLQFFTIFLAPLIGTLIAEAVRRVIGNRRSRTLYQVATAGAAIGSLLIVVTRALAVLLALSGGAGFSLFAVLPLLWPAIYTILVSSTVYYRLAGIVIR